MAALSLSASLALAALRAQGRPSLTPLAGPRGDLELRFTPVAGELDRLLGTAAPAAPLSARAAAAASPGARAAAAAPPSARAAPAAPAPAPAAAAAEAAARKAGQRALQVNTYAAVASACASPHLGGVRELRSDTPSVHWQAVFHDGAEAILAREALARHGVLTLSTGMRVEVCERLGDIGFGHHRFTIRGVPFPYLREGAIAALLADAGNAPTSFEVVWEGIGTLPALAAAEAPTAGNHGVFLAEVRFREGADVVLPRAWPYSGGWVRITAERWDGVRLGAATPAEAAEAPAAAGPSAPTQEAAEAPAAAGPSAPTPEAPSAPAPAPSPVHLSAAAPARSPAAPPAAAPARSSPAWVARRDGCPSLMAGQPRGGLRGSAAAAADDASGASSRLQEAVMLWLEDGHDLAHAQQTEVLGLVQSRHPASWRAALSSPERVPLALQRHLERLARLVRQSAAPLRPLPVSAPAPASPPPPVPLRVVTREVTMRDAAPAAPAPTPAPLLQPRRQRRGACAAGTGSGDVAMVEAAHQAEQPDTAMADVTPPPQPQLRAQRRPGPAAPARAPPRVQLMPPTAQPPQPPLRAPPALPGPPPTAPAPALPSPVLRPCAHPASGAAGVPAAQRQRSQRRHRRPDEPCLAPGLGALPPPPPLPPPPALPGPPQALPARSPERRRAPLGSPLPAATDSGSERALQPSSPVRHRRAGDTASRRNPPRQRSRPVPWYSCTGRPSSGAPAPP